MNNFAFAIEVMHGIEDLLKAPSLKDSPKDPDSIRKAARAWEISTCINNGFPYIAYNEDDVVGTNVKLADIKRVLVRANRFHDPESIEELNKTLGPRGKIDPVTWFEKHHRKKSIISAKDDKKITDWFRYLGRDDLKREVAFMSPRDWDDESKIPEISKKRCFIKPPMKRGFEARIYKSFKEFLKECYGVVRTPAIISEPIEIKRDSSGTLEYRCFIVGHKVSTVSRNLDNPKHNVPGEVADFANECAARNKNKLPPLYVMDIGYTDRGLVVIELNPLAPSGLFVRNDPAKFMPDVMKYVRTLSK